MFCKNCGAQMQEDAAFCPKCGAAAEKEQKEASEPKKLVEKAGNAFTKRRALIGAGAGILALGIIVTLILALSPKPEWEGDLRGGRFNQIFYKGVGGAVTIPSEVKVGSKFYPVTYLGSGLFGDDNRSNITSVKIPDSVTEIGPGAFRNCIRLTKVEIPDSVTSIWNGAFEGCSSLTKVEIPDSVTYIGNGTLRVDCGGAFEGCSSLTSVEIPDGVTEIPNSAFEGCSSLTSVEIPDSVTVIGQSAFEGCSNLRMIKIPDGVTSIGGSAFRGCSNLSIVEMSLSSVQRELDSLWSVFGNCDSLESILVDGVEVPLNVFINGTFDKFMEKHGNEWNASGN